DFALLRQKTGLDPVLELAAARTHGRAQIELLDLRDYRLVAERSGAIIERVAQPGDPRGYVNVDLGRESALVPLEGDAHLFRAPDYDGDESVRRHSGGRHSYVFARTILESDLFVNVPKLKVHRKVGATLCLKNLVGAIGDKSCLPHWRAGGPDTGGDEFALATGVNALRSRYDFALRRGGKVVWALARPLGHILLRAQRRLRANQPLAHIVNGDWY